MANKCNTIQYNTIHSFQDSINLLCSCSLDVESTIYYFLHCLLSTIERHTLLNKISQVDNKLQDCNKFNLMQHPLFGDLLETQKQVLKFPMVRDLMSNS